MAEVAGSDVSRTMIHFVETGQARPSKRVLGLIARRTGKAPSYFMVREGVGPREDEDLATELSAAVVRLKRFARGRQLSDVERDGLLLAEVALRQAASLVRSIQRRRQALSKTSGK